MTTPDEQRENNASEPVEPKVESIYIGFGRGSYSATQDAEDSNLLFERFLDPSQGPSEPYPDIDGNFVDGDRIRAQTMEYLTQKYRSK